MSGRLRINLKDKLDFIESILIPSFDENYQLDSSKKRKDWMKQEASMTNWNMVMAAELIKRYGTVGTLEQAARYEVEVTAKMLKEKWAEKDTKQGMKLWYHCSCLPYSLLFLAGT